MPDRLVVDLDDDGHARVSSWPDGGMPEQVSRAPLAWPLDADALEDLRVLKEAGLVADRVDGTRRIYQLRQQGVQAMHGYLDQMWSQAMAAFQTHAPHPPAGCGR